MSNNDNDDGIDFLITWKGTGKQSIIADRDIDALSQRKPGGSRQFMNKWTGRFEEPIRIEPLPRHTLTRQRRRPPKEEEQEQERNSVIY